MAANRKIAFGPVALGVAAANILHAADAGAGAVGYTPGGSYVTVTRLRVINETATPRTVSGFIGATGASAAGTGFGFVGTNVPANDAVEIFCEKRINGGANGFLTMLASAATALTVEGDAEVGDIG
mgnify:CR=1 FL=1